MKMSMKTYWNDTVRENPKYTEENLTHCCCVHHKSHLDWVGIKTWTFALRGLRLTAWSMVRSITDYDWTGLDSVQPTQ